MLQKVFPFRIQTVQTDNGTEFTYKYISDTEANPFQNLGLVVAAFNEAIEQRTFISNIKPNNPDGRRKHFTFRRDCFMVTVLRMKGEFFPER